MALRVRILSPARSLLVLLLSLPMGVARAGTECMTVDDFNNWMTSHEATSSLILRYDATGVNPNDWPGTKGCLADLAHKACTTGASIALKVYGPDDPPNEAHPTGTLKQEYGDSCCESGDCGETWADPNASDVVFTDGSEVCTVTVWTDPDTFGYELDCTSGSFVGVGTNDYDMPVDYIALFSLSDGSTWKMENAVSTWNEVCFEAPDEGADDGGDDGTDGGSDGGSAELGPIEDVTVSASLPSSVYPDENDLSVEAADSEVYLLFDLRDIPGTVTSATLYAHSHSDSSAEGSGADVYLAASTAWSESTLSWDARPGTTGGALDRVAPVSTDQDYDWDVSAAVSEPALYAFALVPQTSDTNGAHFHSDESSLTDGPRLLITYTSGSGDGSGDGGDDGGSGGGGEGGDSDTDVDADGDGWIAGQDCDDDHASVYPGSTEFCADELDGDCDGLVDQDDPDCASPGNTDTGTGNHPKACLCSGSPGGPGRGLVLLLLSGGLLWRRRIRGH